MRSNRRRTAATTNLLNESALHLIAYQIEEYIGNITVYQGFEHKVDLKVHHTRVGYILEARTESPFVKEVVEQATIVALGFDKTVRVQCHLRCVSLVERGKSYNKIRLETVATISYTVHMRFLYIWYELVIIADVRDDAVHVRHGVSANVLKVYAIQLRFQCAGMR